MSKKIYQVVIYKSISDEEKLAKYAALAGPAIKGAGGKFLARGIPVMTKESGEKTRTVVLEWESLEHAENGYNSEGYQEALRALDGAAIREFRYVEAARRGREKKGLRAAAARARHGGRGRDFSLRPHSQGAWWVG